MIQHLTTEQIITLHDECLKRYGGLKGIAVEDTVSALIERVKNRQFYEGIDDLFELAAMYCEAIARRHVFFDGNKRSSINAALVFLYLNKTRIKNPVNLDDIVIDVATGKITHKELAEIFRVKEPLINSNSDSWDG